MRGGPFFGPGWEALQNVKGDARSQARCPLDLAAWCRRESVDGRREGRPERGRVNDAENCVKGRRFLPPSPRIRWFLCASLMDAARRTDVGRLKDRGSGKHGKPGVPKQGSGWSGMTLTKGILPSSVRVHASSIPTCALSLNARKALIFDAQFLKFRYKMYASILVVRSWPSSPLS
jgi:hypothetical protein